MDQRRRLSGHTRLAVVIGDPVRHSLSPAIHNAGFAALGMDWAFLACEVPEGRVPEALAGAVALGVEGLSVTMPHKAAAAAAVDELSATARLLGAVNCVSRRGDRLVGHSTDGGGFTDALADEAGWVPAGARCAVLGAGGAARAVTLALSEAGAAEVAVVNRTQGNAEAAAALARDRGRVAQPAEVGGFDLIVNATPLGMSGHSGAPMPLDPDLLRPDQLLVDLIYEPAETALLAAARRRGLRAFNGVRMLVHQAARAFGLWTGAEAPVDAMVAATEQALAQR
ncbi:MAG: shikimate dehydrogenase [bacterium]|nr:shikimate dehydrogenase [bacterium]MCY3925159.1 shikimate dehydrogenase [bacterium]